MNLELKLRKVGNSLGVVLPKEALAHLKAEEGDSVLLTETPDGFHVSATNQDFAKTMATFGDLAQRYRDTLRELAK